MHPQTGVDLKVVSLDRIYPFYGRFSFPVDSSSGGVGVDTALRAENIVVVKYDAHGRNCLQVVFYCRSVCGIVNDIGIHFIVGPC